MVRPVFSEQRTACILKVAVCQIYTSVINMVDKSKLYFKFSFPLQKIGIDTSIFYSTEIDFS